MYTCISVAISIAKLLMPISVLTPYPGRERLTNILALTHISKYRLDFESKTKMLGVRKSKH